MKKYPIQIIDNEFVWREGISPADTVFVRLEVKPNLLGRITYPQVKTQNKQQRLQCFFEKGKTGPAYLNLTSWAETMTAKNKIKLVSKELSWQKDGQLIINANNISPKAKVLVIAAHPDDAELAAFNFYSTHNSTILTITAGESGKIKNRELKGKHRVINSITTPMLGDVNPEYAINLSYPDENLLDLYANKQHTVDTSKYRTLNASTLTPPSSKTANWQTLTDEITEIVTKIKPEIVVLPHPILDKNSDHLAATLATLQAIKNCGLNSGQLLFYIIHSNYSHKYPYGPQGSSVTTPPNFGHEHKLYSCQLTQEQQLSKTFALDSMYDLRAEPNHLCTLKLLLKQKIAKLLGKYNSQTPYYNMYRKFIRANELFLTSDFAELDKMIKITTEKADELK